MFSSVIINKSASSFCYYPSPDGKSELIDLQRLKDVILFAQKENLTINFLPGEKTLPKEYWDVMHTIRHVVIAPSVTMLNNSEDILVLNHDDNIAAHTSEKSEYSNVIVRIKKKHLPDLFSIAEDLKSCRRVHIVLLDIDTFTDADFKEYNIQLGKLKASYETALLSGENNELNLLTDRLVLPRMNNCEAGVLHVTLAPNGRFYICPAFYFEDEDDSIGDLKCGIKIKNRQLYKMEHAPICRECDAFQCKRCVYLNRKTTLEVNTPSHQQCVVSHLERNCSKELFDKMKPFIPGQTEAEIPDIDYLDPFESKKFMKKY